VTVALVLVSHSAAAAEGTAEIARQMAPDVTVLAAGGTEDGIGTSFDRVLTALETVLEAGDGVVVLTDLGSAVLTTDAVLEMLDDDVASLVRVPSAPFVEGAVAAAVAAQQGGDLDAVEAAAVRAGTMYAEAASSSTGTTASSASTAPVEPAPEDGVLRAMVVLRNPLGLHARPAAVLARAVADSGASVRVAGVNGSSVLELMALGATGGQELLVEARGEGARAALDTVVSLVEGGFGET
jgi:PTS hybrid protein